ncbi:vacuolar protein sorting associated protein 11 [Trichuris trichiura]|uniref:Vacuolar protein sorting associated protein 11 n=1 Tax=Trichuris trichiura TaxID=36087 RepID=A0A077YXQ5_TRITR|nr:vacuolar protein sorting associated protein 11 [Trichuris trichiura]
MVKDPTNGVEPYSDLKDLNIACCSAGENIVCIGDRDGGVHLLDQQWNDTYFRAYKVTLCLLLCPRVDKTSLQDDDDGINPYLKVWQLDRFDKQGVPFVVRCSKTSPSNRPVKVSSLAVDCTLTLMAIGFEDSSLLLYRGDVRKERLVLVFCRQGKGAVVGLAFHNLSPDTTILYAVTTQLTMSFVLGSKEKEVKKVTLFCQRFQLAMLLVNTNIDNIGKSTLSLVRAQRVKCIINRWRQFLAYFAPIPEVQDIFVAWESLFILTVGGRLYCLKEMDLKSKLDLLFRKNLFDLAINTMLIAKSKNERLIRQRQAILFYRKGDYSNAFKQYSKTIGSLETSYVIRKVFLEVRRIDNLVEYLEAVFQAGQGNSEHANLLLNCYSKQGRKDKIDQLQLPFDQAAELTKRCGYPERCLAVLMSDIKDFKQAIQYIGTLATADRQSMCLSSMGKKLCATAEELLLEFVFLRSAKENKHFWGYLLKWFANDPTVSEHYVIEALRHIQDAQAMEPMMVVQILGSSQHLTFSCIRVFTLIIMDRQTVSDVVISPTVHYLCKHSFHQSDDVAGTLVNYFAKGLFLDEPTAFRPSEIPSTSVAPVLNPFDDGDDTYE